MPKEQSRELPTSLESEEALLACLFEEPTDSLPIVMEILDPDDFYSSTNRTIYEAILRLYNEGQPIDLATVTDQLQRMQQLEKVGGMGRIAELSNVSHLLTATKTYARAIGDKSVERKLIKISQSVAEEAYSGARDMNDLLAFVEESYLGVTKQFRGRTYSNIAEVIPEILSTLEEAAAKRGITGKPTGFIDLDRHLRGLQDSDLIYVGARPGMGKTAFMLEIARYAAVQKKIPVAFFNLEMSKKQMGMRLLSSQSGVSNTKLASGDLTDRDWIDLATAAGELSNSPLYIDDVIDSSIQSIRTKCRKLKKEKNVGIIFIDYLQLVTSSSKRGGGSRQEEVSDISRALKMMARELDVPVIVGCQLSRLVESRPDKHPMLSDLRESGTLEQDADIVMFLYRDFYYNKQPEFQNIAEVIVAKFRNGSTKTINLMFDAEHVCFRNMTTRES